MALNGGLSVPDFGHDGFSSAGPAGAIVARFRGFGLQLQRRRAPQRTHAEKQPHVIDLARRQSTHDRWTLKGPMPRTSGDSLASPESAINNRFAGGEHKVQGKESGLKATTCIKKNAKQSELDPDGAFPAVYEDSHDLGQPPTGAGCCSGAARLSTRRIAQSRRPPGVFVRRPPETKTLVRPGVGSTPGQALAGHRHMLAP